MPYTIPVNAWGDLIDLMGRREYDGDGAPAYEIEAGDGHPGQMEDLGLRKFRKLKREKRMPKAEEVFLIVRELSKAKGGFFRWRTFHRAALAVMRPGLYQKDSGFKCTVGSMLRAQVRHGTIHRISRGLYRFNQQWKSGRPVSPLYVNPGRFNMTPGETGGRRKPW